MKNNKRFAKHRAFLKWAGGKYSLVDAIDARLPKSSKLIEPFVGAGSVFLNTDFSSYLLNDINPDLIGLYNLLKQAPQDVIREAKGLFIPENNDAERYYALREEFNACRNDPLRRSVLFLYLNRHGYNGLCRYNRSGGYNVPFGRYKAPYFPERELNIFADKAAIATFTCLPYQKVFARARRNHTIYCDPPYAPISDTAKFTEYAMGGFSMHDQKQLATLAVRAATKRHIPVLISNHDTAFTREIYRQACISELQVKRSISQKGNKRQKVGELLALFEG